jgi:hypothetical protein
MTAYKNNDVRSQGHVAISSGCFFNLFYRAERNLHAIFHLVGTSISGSRFESQ